MSTDGTNKTAITNLSTDVRFPSWSADGSKLAFMSDHDGNYEVYVTDVTGSNQTISRLTNNSAQDGLGGIDW